MSLAAKFAALAGELSLGELGGAVGWTASAHDLLDFLFLLLVALHLFHGVLVSSQCLGVLCLRGAALLEHVLDGIQRDVKSHFGGYHVVLHGKFVVPFF